MHCFINNIQQPDTAFNHLAHGTIILGQLKNNGDNNSAHSLLYA